jgi:hypothetical protein
MLNTKRPFYNIQYHENGEQSRNLFTLRQNKREHKMPGYYHFSSFTGFRYENFLKVICQKFHA